MRYPLTEKDWGRAAELFIKEIMGTNVQVTSIEFELPPQIWVQFSVGSEPARDPNADPRGDEFGDPWADGGSRENRAFMAKAIEQAPAIPPNDFEPTDEKDLVDLRFATHR